MIYTFLDGRSKDGLVSHVTRDRNSIGWVNLIDVFGLFLILFLKTGVDSLFLFFQFSKNILSSGDKFIFSLIGLLELCLVAGCILIVLNK